MSQIDKHKWNKTYREKNKDKINKKQELLRRKKGILPRKKYLNDEERKEDRKEYRKKYYSLHKKEEIFNTINYNKNHEEKKRLYDKKYKKINKEKINERTKKYIANKTKTDINYKLSKNLRGRLYHAIKDNQKSGSAVKDLGCSIPELKTHLESKFQKGMTWNNYCYRGWHIDHTIPLASFNLTDKGDFLKANHYTNLQPLWAEENFKKGKTQKP